ncbi:MAG: helix-turn-helix domain-containing protein [Clostridia bacterium]|nr:helix-turn-helix domain-containing protein [Clostridia bacterium]
MDCMKIGKLIFKLRKEKALTQLELARAIGVSDKAVSKWERGLGCPDVTLLGDISRFFGINIPQLLEGELNPNKSDAGNMKKLRFYCCHCCGNILTATAESDISCCGRRLEALVPSPVTPGHIVQIEAVEDDFFISLNHSMTKEHFIRFVAYAAYDRALLIRLYPEQDCSVRFPRMRGGKLVWFCSEHGLFETKA